MADVPLMNNPMTTQDDLIVAGASGVPGRLAKGSDGQVLTVDPSTHHLVWATPGAGGAVATDAIWDAAGDLAVGSGANTAARLAIGAAGGHLSRINGAVAWDSGTSFPGAAAAGDRYWRTDRNLAYFYDGTRWLSMNLYRENMSGLVSSTTTSGQVVGRLPTWHSTYDLWLDALWTTLYVGTTNTGSAYWTAALKKYQSDFSTSSTLASIDTSANSPNVAVAATASIGALLTPATYKILQVEVAKTGSPGLIHPAAAVTYRLVG